MVWVAQNCGNGIKIIIYPRWYSEWWVKIVGKQSRYGYTGARNHKVALYGSDLSPIWMNIIKEYAVYVWRRSVLLM